MSSKQIIDLVVAVDPILADLKDYLGRLDPDDDTIDIANAREIVRENVYLRNVLVGKVREYH